MGCASELALGLLALSMLSRENYENLRETWSFLSGLQHRRNEIQVGDVYFFQVYHIKMGKKEGGKGDLFLVVQTLGLKAMALKDIR